MRELAEQFIELFDGLPRAYGVYQLNNPTTKASGKQLGHAATLMKPVTIDLWQGHLAGKEGIGIIPIKDNSCCCFGAIDIDSYAGLDFTNIIKQIKKYNFPLIACRSKSGGCHLFLFTSEEVPAALLQGKLKEMAALLGYANCEIFPRQTEILVERGDIGQWLNMPYFDGIKGLRYALTDDGRPIHAKDFVILAHSRQITKAQLQAIKVNISADLEDGPPCLQYLIAQGFPEGTRNDGLFNLGVYLQKAFPDDWKTRVEEFNVKYMGPPLRSDEVQGVFKSLGKKDYFYTCNKAPVVGYCNKELCATRKFGIGDVGMPNLSSLTKYNSSPPVWFVDVEGAGRLELSTEDLQQQERFQRRCMESLNIMPPVVKKNSWQTLIQKLLSDVTMIEAPVDASPVGQLIEYLEKFCTSRVQAQNKAEILLGKPFLEGGRHYFKMSDFTAYLERQHFRDFKVNKIASILKEKLHATHQFVSIKGKGLNCWSVPEFSKQTEDQAIPAFVNTEPY
jgi:hypothetical protein